MSETLYVIDVFSLVFQVFHAIPAMTSPAGQPTNAVFGFARDVLGILRNHKPTYLVAAMDSPERGVREELYPEYKANRAEMPPDLRPQIAVVAEVIRAFGIPVIQHAGWEADDVLATLAKRAELDGINAVMVTNDKDARQLISSRVRMLNVRKGTFMDADAVIADWGVRPDQVVEFQALVGDSVDNVPGVPQIGPKTAASLLNQFGSLEELLRRADEVTAKKVRENLKTYPHLARISRQLVELNTNLEIDFDWNIARVGRFDAQRLVELFRECGFRRLIDEIRELAPAAEVSVPKLFADGEPSVTVAQSVDDLQRWLQRNPKADLAIRLESSGLNALSHQILGMTLADDARNALFVPLDTKCGNAPLQPNAVWDCVATHLNASGRRLVGHDLKPIAAALHRVGLTEAELGLDTMVGSYLLASGSRSHSLSAQVERYFSEPLEQLTRRVVLQDGKVQSWPSATLAEAAAEEACLCLRVAERMQADLAAVEMTDLYDKLERPLISVLADMERAGVKVDAAELGRQNEDITARLGILLHEIHAEAQEEFNIDSPKQLREILFDKLQLPVIKKTKTGPSTDQDVLEELAKVHPLPAKIIEHRHLTKLKGTYLDALVPLINPQTGRIHASFNQVTAATGRLSCSNPNLQNIPIRTPEGERIRRAFIAQDTGWKLICADYSQIELRMLAHFSHDVSLRQAFADGIDVHSAVAAQVFGLAPENVDSTQRRIAKAVNFGVVYGQSAFGLSEVLGIPREEAAAFIEGYFQKYHGVADFMDRTLDLTAELGYAKTILGRRRAITGIRDDRKGQLNMPERTAVNTVIQGSAADLIKQAMINVAARLKREKHAARLLLQIHDELMFEAPAAEAEALAELVRHEMEHALPLDVPLKVDISIGDNWLDAK